MADDKIMLKLKVSPNPNPLCADGPWILSLGDKVMIPHWPPTHKLSQHLFFPFQHGVNFL